MSGKDQRRLTTRRKKLTAEELRDQLTDLICTHIPGAKHHQAIVEEYVGFLTPLYRRAGANIKRAATIIVTSAYVRLNTRIIMAEKQTEKASSPAVESAPSRQEIPDSSSTLLENIFETLGLGRPEPSENNAGSGKNRRSSAETSNTPLPVRMAPRTIRELQTYYDHYWSVLGIQTSRRLEDCDVVADAMGIISSEMDREIEIAKRLTFEAALEQVDKTSQRVQKATLSRQGRKGRAARQPDSMTKLIEEIIRKRPSISGREVVEKLCNSFKIDPDVVDIDEEKRTIQYRQKSHFKGDVDLSTPKLVTFSAIKHRVSRIKNKNKKKPARKTAG